MTRFRGQLLLLLGVALGFAAQAQVDPVKRQLVQVGYNQPLQGVSPLGGYAFYYLNEPDYPRTNLTLRLAVAPVYLDAELGLRGLLGPNTDLGLGLDGGGFADSYSEVRGGHYIREESYLGHGFGGNVSLYHRFNPSQELPLYGVVRAGYHYAFYGRDTGTAAGFSEPENLGQGIVRAGLRLGGGEPVLIPELGVELSGWYEGRFRTDQTPYGYGGDRFLARDSHLIWGRMGFNYAFKGGQNLALNITGGTCLNPDRLSAYRLGSWLPMGSEFPLNLPGYYYQEISARNFVNASAQWIQPLDRAQRWSLLAMVATAVVDYAPGLEQPGKWHTGLGAGIAYRPPSKAWQVIVGYGYGVDAIRHDERGAHSIGILAQFDFQKARTALLNPGNQPLQSRGLQNFFRKIF